MTARWLAAVLLLAGLSGCGFHLRGYEEETQTQGLGNLYVVEERAEDLAEAVRSRVSSGGARLVTDPEEADHTLTLSEARIRRSVLSVSAQTGRAEEYQLTLTLQMTLTGPAGEVLIDAETLRLTEDYTLDPDAVLGSFSEEQVLRDEMLERAATQVVQRATAAARERP